MKMEEDQSNAVSGEGVLEVCSTAEAQQFEQRAAGESDAGGAGGAGAVRDAPLVRKKNPQISDLRVRFWDADFKPSEARGGHLFGWFLQCKIKENGLKIGRVTH